LQYPPTIGKLAEQGKLPISGPIVCIGQQKWSTEQFRTHLTQRFRAHAGEVAEGAREKVCERLEYHGADVTDPTQLATVLGREDRPFVLYLAVPPGVAAKVIAGLGRTKIPDNSRIACEKPFGYDAASARNLNDLLRPLFSEDRVFRIDKFLGKQEVQNVLGVRLAKRFF
jgi:glucose-6-phosphate 1-dehydrogenase